MSELTLVLVLVPVAYLVGTFPSAALVGRRGGVDVTTAGSGNPGASNTARLMGWRAGAVVFTLDILKGALAAGVGLALDGHRGALVLGVAAVLGHMFPATRRFRGGRGVATAGGVVLVVYPFVTLGLVVVWLLIAWATRKASVASIAVAVAFPLLVALTGGRAGDVVVTALLAVLIVVRHGDNVRRLVKGEELGLDPNGPTDGDDVPPEGDPGDRTG